MRYDRRRLLGLLGTGLATSVAGCSGDGGGAEPTAAETDQPTTTQPGGDGTTATTEETGDGTDEDGETTASVAWNVVGHTPQNHTYDGAVAGPGGEPTRRWRWEYPLVEEAEYPGVVYSTPVADDGTLYSLFSGYFRDVGTDSNDDGETYRNRLVAVDAANGEQQWETQVAPEDGWANGLPAPTVGDGAVVVYVRTLQAIDAESGERRWQNENARTAYGPLVADAGEVFVPSAGDGTSLAVYDLADGSERWTALDRVSTNSFVGLSDDTVFAAARDEVVALDRSDGTELWRTSAGTESVVLGAGRLGPVHAPVVDDEAVYVAGGYQAAVQRDTGAVVALDRSDGTERWRFKPEAGDAQTEISGVWGLPVLHDGTLYVVGGRGDVTSGSASYQLYAVDADSGVVEWEASTPSLTFQLVGAGEFVYAVTGDRLLAYSTADGSQVGSASVDPGTLSSTLPNVLAGETLATASQNGLVGFGPN
ncbi:outer membrane protein assembly factor BamB family protein [Haloarchaeobius baliensis]|uniref:outer membrane protein assembly factor BamB family protein n=1 Tax=Haloarchaeobius baliensis TaxID=1670458 RepID=UPI003F885352